MSGGRNGRAGGLPVVSEVGHLYNFDVAGDSPMIPVFEAFIFADNFPHDRHDRCFMLSGGH